MKKLTPPAECQLGLRGGKLWRGKIAGVVKGSFKFMGSFIFKAKVKLVVLWYWCGR